MVVVNSVTNVCVRGNKMQAGSQAGLINVTWQSQGAHAQNETVLPNGGQVVV